MEQLKEKYADRGVEIMSMYVREPHPEERGFTGYTQHQTYDQKMAYARELVDTRRLDIPVMVDGIDQANHIELGNLPNVVYVVDKAGKVRLNEEWLLPDDVDRVLAELVTTDDPSRPMQPTVDTSGVGTAI